MYLLLYKLQSIKIDKHTCELVYVYLHDIFLFVFILYFLIINQQIKREHHEMQKRVTKMNKIELVRRL